jgi:hypothetical protein
MDEERAKLQHLVSDDLPNLTDYYLELSSEKGPGILVVDYYPEPDPDESKLDPEFEFAVQCTTRFLKKSQIPKFIEESGLEELQADFEVHDPQTQMVLAVVTEDKMGVLTFDVHRPENKPLPTKTKRSRPRGFGQG